LKRGTNECFENAPSSDITVEWKVGWGRRDIAPAGNRRGIFSVNYERDAGGVKKTQSGIGRSHRASSNVTVADSTILLA